MRLSAAQLKKLRDSVKDELRARNPELYTDGPFVDYRSVAFVSNHCKTLAEAKRKLVIQFSPRIGL